MSVVHYICKIIEQTERTAYYNVVFFLFSLCLVRRLARKRRNDGDSGVDSASLSHKVHICSVNNFPTAAGLASSAAGFACLGELVCAIIHFC